MSRNKDFFRDEVRNGFYIPTAMKQAWSTSLTVLSEIDRICKKYNITYFADWGSLLGAIRHGGYVPWDDDLDIFMKRPDYKRFREVADKELPDGFAIHDFERKENHWLFLSRVVNSNQISFDEEHLKKYNNFPYIATVDIFVKDYIYRDEEKETERCNEIMRILAIAEGIINGGFSEDIKKNCLLEIKKNYNITIDPKADNRTIGIELYKIAEEQMGRTLESESDRITQIFPWGLKGSKGLPKEQYDTAVYVPFETTTIPVPAAYDTILKERYNDYFKIYKVWDGHDYPFYEGQKKNLQEVADFKIPEYSFDWNLVRNGYLQNKECYKYFVKEYDKVLYNLSLDVCNHIESKEDTLLQMMSECQQLAVDLGTLIEEVTYITQDITSMVVSSLEDYCDVLYTLYQLVTAETHDTKELLVIANNLKDSIILASSLVKQHILERKQIVFVTTSPRQWEEMSPIYEEMQKDEYSDVYVIPIPILFKDIYGKITDSTEEIIEATQLEQYPKELNLLLWTEYNLTLHYPDVIYIQDPYDGENPRLTTPNQFYSRHLQIYTKELIFVSSPKADDFKDDDIPDWYNMKHYVTAPGVICSDKVIVYTERMKQLYIEKLVAFAGNETRELWEQKMVVMEWLKKDAKVRIGNRMLYCIGVNEWMNESKDIIHEIEHRLKEFEKYKEILPLTVYLYPPSIDEWNKVDAELTKKLSKLLSKYKNNEWCEINDWTEVDWNKLVYESKGYYGSPSPLLNMFRYSNKAVMVSNYR